MNKKEFLTKANMLSKLIDSKEWNRAFIPWLETQIEKNEKIISIAGKNDTEIASMVRIQKSKVDVYKNIPNAIKNIILEAENIKEADNG